MRVTLFRGVTGVDREDFVGIYRLGIGETKTLNDLRAAGIEPFKITLLDTVPPLPPPPAFDNDTKAIEIVSVRSENSPSPAYILTLRNLSEKSVQALGLDMTFDGRPGPIAFFKGEEDRPLIPSRRRGRAVGPRNDASTYGDWLYPISSIVYDHPHPQRRFL